MGDTGKEASHSVDWEAPWLSWHLVTQMLNNCAACNRGTGQENVENSANTCTSPQEKGAGTCLLMVRPVCPKGNPLEGSRLSMNRSILCASSKLSSKSFAPVRSFKPQTISMRRVLRLSLFTLRNRSTEKLRRPVQGDSAAKWPGRAPHPDEGSYPAPSCLLIHTTESFRRQVRTCVSLARK